MKKAAFTHDALKRALQTYLRQRNSDRPVSIANAIRSTRYALPGLVLSDDEMEQIIAEEIVRGRGNIAFDRHAE